MNSIIVFGLIFVAGVIASLGSTPPRGEDDTEQEVLSPPETYPFVFELKSRYESNEPGRGNCMADIDGDGYSEYINWFHHEVEQGQTASAILAAKEGVVHFQYNGPYSNARIAACRIRDVIGNRNDDLILVRGAADSIVLEILGYSVGSKLDTIRFIAAVNTAVHPHPGWHDLNIIPLAGIDLNGDSNRDLIYSRSAKLNGVIMPDSAFERGLVAYDVTHRRQLWFFPLADMVGERSFEICVAEDGTPVFVFCTNATMNGYSVNGMDSRHSYLVAIDRSGRELWRTTLARDRFCYVSIAALDADGDGKQEIIAPMYESSGATDSQKTDLMLSTTAVLLDPFNGKILAKSPSFVGDIQFFWPVAPRPDDSAFLVASALQDGYVNILILDNRLQLIKSCEGPFVQVSLLADIDGDGEQEILVGLKQGGFAALDMDLNILGWIEQSGTPMSYVGPAYRGIFFDMRERGYQIYAMRKQAIMPLLYARYQWWLIVAAAVVLAVLIIQFARWVLQLYQSSLGLPGLDKITAMVMVMNRKGKIVYVNRDPLAQRLLGNSRWRRRPYHKTNLATYPGVDEAIKQSFSDPYLPIQAQFDIEDGGGSSRLELVIYPRVDKSNSFLGKILIANDISGKVGWERKAVLGEAAQRWIHKLKGNMATAKLGLDNMLEDQRLSPQILNHPAFQSYIGSIKNQIEETAETATKILRYARITKPEKVLSDINRIIETAVAPYAHATQPGMAVVKKLQSDLPPIEIDPEQILEVLDNLLSNAMKAVGPGGDISIQSRLADGLRALSGMKTVEIMVEDTGCGIAPKNIDKIFQAGFSKSASGTGIGLAIVKEIIDNHGAAIDVRSEIGRGTRFIIQFPVGT